MCVWVCACVEMRWARAPVSFIAFLSLVVASTFAGLKVSEWESLGHLEEHRHFSGPLLKKSGVPKQRVRKDTHLHPSFLSASLFPPLPLQNTHTCRLPLSYFFALHLCLFQKGLAFQFSASKTTVIPRIISTCNASLPRLPLHKPYVPPPPRTPRPSSHLRFHDIPAVMGAP